MPSPTPTASQGVVTTPPPTAAPAPSGRPAEAFGLPTADRDGRDGGSGPGGTTTFSASMAMSIGGFEWTIPSLALSVPGLLVVIAIVLQVGGGLAWLPVIRRRLGGFGLWSRRAAGRSDQSA